jgi:hypothetical protein
VSTYRAPIVNGKPPQTVDSGVFQDTKFDPNSTSPTYIGQHVTKGASEGATDWKITKLTSTSAQVAYGSWTNRASYF